MIRPLAALLALSLALAAPGLASAAQEQAPQDLIASVVARVSPAVVRVIVVRPPSANTESAESSMAKAADSSGRNISSLGSGFIIDPSGYIATNRHVVEDSISVFVSTSDGIRYQASIVGLTQKADMALLKVDAGKPLPAVSFGDSDKVRVGDSVIAIGSPFGFDNSVTSGIVSALNRDIMESPFDDYFQTDASINHGNSGGPLFNLMGEVIGMNSVIFAPGAGSAGVGFAIPSNDLNFVFSRIMKTGEIHAGMLPIYTQQVSWMLGQALSTQTLHGALVSAIHDEGDRMLNGQILPGDLIVSFNGQPVADPRDLARKAAQAEIGSEATLEIDRGRERDTVRVKIQQWPEGQLPVPAGLHQKLGLDLINANREDGRPLVKVASVDPTGTAADSGIQKDDVILEVQRVPVSDSDQALRILRVQSFRKLHYAALLIERDKKQSWMPIAIPANTD